MSTYVYPAYYRRTIEQFTQGLKLVLGGTGLGKTSSLAALLREGDYPADVKFIYVANRIQLLDEMAKQMTDEKQYVQQHKDAEQLRQALVDYSLDALLAHPHTPELLAEYKRRERLPATP